MSQKDLMQNPNLLQSTHHLLLQALDLSFVLDLELVDLRVGRRQLGLQRFHLFAGTIDLALKLDFGLEKNFFGAFEVNDSSLEL